MDKIIKNNRIGDNKYVYITKDCLIGIEAIDKEHEQLFKMINDAAKMH